MVYAKMKRFKNALSGSTLREVAHKAGVSIATASYALNETGRTSAETKARVLKVAEDLDYSPSIAAKILKGIKGNLVAILTDGLAGPWYGELLEGLQPSINARGYAVAAMTLQKDSLTLCRSLASAGFIRGLVVLNPLDALAPFLEPLIDCLPTVAFDPEERYGKATKYLLDNRRGIAALMGHLWGRGYRDYLWLDGNLEGAWDAKERFEAYDEFLDGKGLPQDRRQRAMGGFSKDMAMGAMAAILDSGRRPRAVVAANDESAIGAMSALRERGLNVPDEVAVAGFDGLDISSWIHPLLTTLRFDRRSLGRAMAERIVDEIEGLAGEGGTVTIPLELVVGCSA
jgi:LacI family transcriptional regulator